ncbi:MAG: CheR family methyltransferase [Halanaerobiaceae bacterium]
MNKFKLSNEEFENLSQIVFDNIGVNLTNKKKPLIISRLSRRLRQLNLGSFSEYIELLQSDTDELEIFFNLITTNVSKFFREKNHFQYLRNTYLPMIKREGVKTVKAWSAGCSTGEEPYTLAIVLNEIFDNGQEKIEIIASDVNTKVLKSAARGVYRKEKLTKVPYKLLKKYFYLGTGKNRDLFKVKEDIRNLVSFKVINLKDADYTFKKPLDIIFCRNVFIYFNKKTQEEVLKKFHQILKNNGRLFLGHSEKVSRNGGQKSWELCAPTVYRKIE